MSDNNNRKPKSGYKLKFTDGAFSAKNITNIRSKWQSNSEDIVSMNSVIRSLDRYDDFAAMKIAPSKYEKTGEGKYGIEYDEALHGAGEVVTKAQYDAAHSFLQKLRGFGLLADVVGSGKTFEACTVLSELCARGAVETMLIIVPRQVLPSWLETLEIKFGLGEGTLYRYPDITADPRQEPRINAITHVGADGVRRPNRSIIVALEDFLAWNPALNQCFYDAVVVDEAHHLCDRDKEEYSGSMFRLSTIMEVKKANNKPYCLLLSATPHSGDLEKMFRLWYFIRDKGGDPVDFDDGMEQKDDNAKGHTEKYRKELKIYRDEVCRGAKTVYDFINKTKISETEGMCLDRLTEFYNKKMKSSFAGAEYAKLTEGERVNVINKFLRTDESVKDTVTKRIADMYHNGVMRSIMIRNSKSVSDGDRIGRKRKYAVNVFFAPFEKQSGVFRLSGIGGDGISVDLSKLDEIESTVGKLDGGRFIKSHDRWLTLEEYIREEKRDIHTLSAAKAEFYNLLLKAFKVSDKTLAKDFLRIGAFNYYYSQLYELRPEIKTLFSPIASDTDVFSAKLGYLKKILRKHKDERVLVFFDYDKKVRDRIDGKVADALLSLPDLKDRLLFATAANKDTIEAQFNAKDDAILIARDSSVTEGTNLQSSSIVVNFEVTKDPVAMEQRVGRVFRMGQKRDVIVYSLADMRDLEGCVLMYFARIGLLCSDSGDATIIAGSSNNNMVALQCPACSSVKLITSEDYARRAPLEAGEVGALFCAQDEERCTLNSKYGTRMNEISVNDFKCSNSDCGRVFIRQGSGYECLSADHGHMCNDGLFGVRNFYCPKICSLSHCKEFSEGGRYEHCPALESYRMGNRDDSDLVAICATKCRKKCPERCRITYKADSGEEAIMPCTDCPNATCRPRPLVMSFDENWQTPCPACKRGTLKPAVARTFATYVNKLWDFRFDSSAFFENIEMDTDRVASVAEILDNDSEKKKR